MADGWSERCYCTVCLMPSAKDQTMDDDDCLATIAFNSTNLNPKHHKMEMVCDLNVLKLEAEQRSPLAPSCY